MRVSLLALVLASTTAAGAQSIMPMPAEMSQQSGALLITSEFRVAFDGPVDPIVQRATERFLSRLALRTGLNIAARAGPGSEAGNGLQIQCTAPARLPQAPGDDESYSLEITPVGARLAAPGWLGVLRGLETILQLTADRKIPAVRIQDRPRYTWRGLMLDVSRHFLPVEVVLRQLDAMAAVKLNVLHWHLSDDQGIRVESKLYPRLHTAGSGGKYYTQEQIRRVVEYAQERGIRVVPEFDMPGHASAFLAAYPSLASMPGPVSIATTWGLLHPTMDPTRDEVYVFIERFFGEMIALFPDRHFHIGGDEVNSRQWKSSPQIQAFVKEQGLQSQHSLQAMFHRRVSTILGKLQRTMVGWDEILHPDLPGGTVVQSWRGTRYMAKAVQSGFSGVLSAGFYLDHMKSAAYHYANDLGEGEKVLGGEACMWSEYITAANIDMRIWPRMAAIAERFWSPASVRDVADMYARLELVSTYLSELGLEHKSARTRMLQALAGRRPAAPLEILSDALEPVKMYARSTSRSYTTATPMNRLVDATPPESSYARALTGAVDKALSGDTTARVAAQALLTRLRDNHAAVLPILQSNPVLLEVLPLGAYVREVAGVGVDALEYAQRNVTPPPEWRARAAKLLASEGKTVPSLVTQRHCIALMSQYGRRRSRLRRQCAQPRFVQELIPVIVEPVSRLVDALSLPSAAARKPRRSRG
ncbi:MAG: family 20 glycosylhydrolase [Bryobacteraceae bacterium]|nr:family 20 glycosylhydrolase [Bryobacteraceae bacterium]